MPDHIDQVLDSGKVQCVIGDMTLPDFGLKDEDLSLLRREIMVVIHTAADLSLLQDLPRSIKHNYVPAVRIFLMVKSFTSLKRFLFVSSMTGCTFMPDGQVEERLHLVDNNEEGPETQAQTILTTGQSPYQEEFPVSYVQAKYLSERAILGSDVSFTVLVVRPSSIGPAIKDPRPFYGPEDAIQAHTLIRLLIGNREYRTWSVTRKWRQDFIVDEIPVDIAANLTCLLHIASGWH